MSLYNKGMSLSTSPGSGTQGTTQNPQVSAAPASNAAQTSSVQPGTANSLLTSTGGVPLQVSPVTTVSLNNVAATQVAPRPVQHHISPVLAVLPAGLFVVAIVMFWAINRSTKITTN